MIMTKRILLTNMLFFWTAAFVVGQQKSDYLLWSASHKLTVDDFAIKTNGVETTTSFAQFTVDYEVNGFDFLTKNFNKKVHNYFIRRILD